MTHIQVIHDKGSGKINEDEWMIDEGSGVYAVFDGATSILARYEKDGKTSGRIASEIAKHAFIQYNGSLFDLAKKANQDIHSAMVKEGIDLRRKEALWATTVAGVLVRNKYIEYIGVADSLVMALYKNGSHELLTPYNDHDHESLQLLADLKAQGHQGIFSMPEFLAQLHKVRYRANVSYSALNGDPIAGRLFNQGMAPRDGLESVIMFTDGLFLPKSDIAAPELWDEFAELYRKSGLHGILQQVRDVENQDLACTKYPRFKPHDDATAIAIDF